MAFTGPLECPNCRHGVAVRDRYSWRLSAGEYKCPACGHLFSAFVDAGALARGRRLLGLNQDNSFGDRLKAIESAFGVKTRKVADYIEQHSGRMSLLHLCLLANTIDAALQPLRSYAEFCRQTVCIVRSAYEIPEAMAEHSRSRRHHLGPALAAIKSAPERQMGRSFLVGEDGAVVGGVSTISAD